MGQTRGRGRQDFAREEAETVKDIYKMDVFKSLDCLQLHHDPVIHQKIQAMNSDLDATIDYRDFDLSSKGYSPDLELQCQRFFVHALEKSWTEPSIFPAFLTSWMPYNETGALKRATVAKYTVKVGCPCGGPRFVQRHLWQGGRSSLARILLVLQNELKRYVVLYYVVFVLYH